MRDIEAHAERLTLTMDKTTWIAFYAMSALESGTPFEEVLKDKTVAAWWKIHKKAVEAKRKEFEKEVALKKAQAIALAKLTTDEDRKVLGIRKPVAPKPLKV